MLHKQRSWLTASIFNWQIIHDQSNHAVWLHESNVRTSHRVKWGRTLLKVNSQKWCRKSINKSKISTFCDWRTGLVKCVSVREEESKSRRRSRILHTQINQELCLAEKFGGESRKKKKSSVFSTWRWLHEFIIDSFKRHIQLQCSFLACTCACQCACSLHHVSSRWLRNVTSP